MAANALATHRHIHSPGRARDRRTLLMLHGTGDDETGFARLAPVIAPDAAVLSVRGNVSEHGMARFFRRHAEGVYDMADLARRTTELAGFVEAAVSHYRLDPDALIGVGYSNGANILASLLFTRPALVPRAVLMHPLIPFDPPAQPGLAGRSLLITGGERDPIAPAAATRALAGWFAAQGASVRTLLHPGGHELRPEELEAARGFLVEARATTPV
ncbi:MAG TPA: alpha/beta hydrolase [Geminicoccaceae bacterium]